MEPRISEAEARALEAATVWGHQQECTRQAADHAQDAAHTTCAVCFFLFQHAAGLVWTRRHKRQLMLASEGLMGPPDQPSATVLPW